MKKSDLFLMALKNLKDRKTRTKLTVIGVVIGTCAIIIMVSIGVGIDKMITSQIKQSASLNKITIHNSSDLPSSDEEKKLPFNDTAVEYIGKIDHVATVVPTATIDEYVKLKRGKYSLRWGIKAIDFDKMEKMGYELENGSFSKIDKKNTILFGKSSITNFVDVQDKAVKFKYDKDYNIIDCEIKPLKDVFYLAPIVPNENGDKPIELTNSQKKVRGGAVLKGNRSIDVSTDQSVFIDMSVAKELYNIRQKATNGPKKDFEYSEMTVIVDDISNVDYVKEQLSKSGFVTSSADSELAGVKKIMTIVQLVLAAIGAISMFVAAFGISNTMVMSVFERTKEIGIMKVLGCELKDIKAIFLYEAGTIGFIGGTIGLGISYVVSIIANLIAKIVMKSMADGAVDFTVCVSSIPWWLAICGILFSVVIGVLAGISPANRSVKVSALTAIHNE